MTLCRELNTYVGENRVPTLVSDVYPSSQALIHAVITGGLPAGSVPEALWLL